MVEERLIVGRKVKVDSLGILLHHNAANEMVSFVGREADGVIREYSITREKVIHCSGVYSFAESPDTKSHTHGSSAKYGQLDRQLRSAKL